MADALLRGERRNNESTETDGGAFAVLITNQLRDISHDKHLDVSVPGQASSCTVQGCVLPYGVIEVLYGTEEKTWSLPQDLPTPRKWAMSEHKVCAIARELRCGTAIASDVPQPAPEHAAPVPDCLESAAGKRLLGLQSAKNSLRERGSSNVYSRCPPFGKSRRNRRFDRR